LREKSKEHGKRLSLLHFAGAVSAQTLAKHPEINSVVRFNRIYPRVDVDIFFHVASDKEGLDLSGHTVRRVDQMGLVDLARDLDSGSLAIRKGEDKRFNRIKGLFSWLPPLLAGLVLDLSGLILYKLNLWSPLLQPPQDPFGSMMLTNIGGLGLVEAFVPIAPYSRVPLILALGAVTDKAIVRDGQVVAAKVVKACWSFDHRIIDGVHAAKMAKTFTHYFENPEEIKL
jgi:pyruvate dehydrogenase E2 component (dihydrolipoamide acetyltransferase)